MALAENYTKIFDQAEWKENLLTDEKLGNEKNIVLSWNSIHLRLHKNNKRSRLFFMHRNFTFDDNWTSTRRYLFFNLLEHRHPMTEEQSINDNGERVRKKKKKLLWKEKTSEKNHEISELIFLFILQDPE